MNLITITLPTLIDTNCLNQKEAKVKKKIIKKFKFFLLFIGNFWWSIDYANIHFVHMSTEHNYEIGSP